ncbi:16S rRNA (guanine(966)-N(2))-methyltransferase RsmD [Dokdonella sp.]|uniref:16S rRNA (guanine(966)-N(2))-methyltransferase RsmD n=1 Tax=Dokdonella sp. TaxID=2291710 RepID=UPI0031C2764F|nr:16S rRNA (guanine(966)-N(2))-methyltransferase RsmD [Dokdonella sp.]
MSKTRSSAGGGKLRVIAGRLRGSRIGVPDRPGLRPTPDRIRETLFNWLAPYLDGARCLDLYAGSGLLGIEALSRGAAECVFVERDRALASLLQENLARLRVNGARVVTGAALDYLAARPATRFDIAFVDPPFEAGAWAAALASLEDAGWLAPGALIHVEAPDDAAFAVPAAWQLHREGRAGAVRHLLYRAAADPLS